MNFPLYAMDPKDADYDNNLNQIVVLDSAFASPDLFKSGLDDSALADAYTLVRFYGLGVGE